jgi:hypothetical protein
MRPQATSISDLLFYSSNAKVFGLLILLVIRISLVAQTILLLLLRLVIYINVLALLVLLVVVIVKTCVCMLTCADVC